MVAPLGCGGGRHQQQHGSGAAADRDQLAARRQNLPAIVAGARAEPWPWRCEAGIGSQKGLTTAHGWQATAHDREATRWTACFQSGARQLVPLRSAEPFGNRTLLSQRRPADHASFIRAASPHPSCARAHSQLSRRPTFPPPCPQVCPRACTRGATLSRFLFWTRLDLAVLDLLEKCSTARACISGRRACLWLGSHPIRIFVHSPNRLPT